MDILWPLSGSLIRDFGFQDLVIDSRFVQNWNRHGVHSESELLPGTLRTSQRRPWSVFISQQSSITILPLMSRQKENSSVPVRECLNRISSISLARCGPRVSRTVAEALKEGLCPVAGIRNGAPAKNAPGSLKIGLADESWITGPANPPVGQDWMYFRLESNGSGEIVASRASLIYTLFCHIRDIWLDAEVSMFVSQRLFTRLDSQRNEGPKSAI